MNYLKIDKMLTKKQITIFSVFKKDIFAKLMFKDIKGYGKQKSNSIVQNALKKFKDEELIVSENTGDITTYSLNISNSLALSYISLINHIEVHKNKKLPKKSMESIKNRLSKHTCFFILLVFGSYAENKATKGSDLDIAAIVNNEKSRKEVIPYIETIKRRETIKIDYHIFTEKEFLEMLAIDEENVGKEIYRKNMIYYGAMEYYNLIGKWKK